MGGGQYLIDSSKFQLIPGSPIAYWSRNLFEIFSSAKSLAQMAIARAGLSTGNNDRYLRLWFEVSVEHIGLRLENETQFRLSRKCFVPCNKGGVYRRWYGNNEYLVNWSEPEKFHRPRTTYIDLYYKEALTWTVLTSGKFCMRYYGCGFLFDHAAASLFPVNGNHLYYFLGFMNTNVANYILDIINPTLNTGADVVLKMPIVASDNIVQQHVLSFSGENVNLAKEDWDAFETSWDFKKHPLI